MHFKTEHLTTMRGGNVVDGDDDGGDEMIKKITTEYKTSAVKASNIICGYGLARHCAPHTHTRPAKTEICMQVCMYHGRHRQPHPKIIKAFTPILTLSEQIGIVAHSTTCSSSFIGH